MPIPAGESCSNCLYATEYGTQFLCRWEPPPHPPVVADDWCGQWMPSEPEVPPEE